MSSKLNEALQIVTELEEHERQELIKCLIDDDELFDDIQDALTIVSRRKDATRDYDEFLGELRRDGRPV